MGLILLIVARILQWVLAPVFVTWAVIKYGLTDWKKLDRYFHKIAFGRDQLGNAMGEPIMNDLLLTKSAIKLYGNVDETISHVTGVNYENKTLTKFGLLVAKILNKIDPNHVQKAAATEQDNTEK